MNRSYSIYRKTGKQNICVHKGKELGRTSRNDGGGWILKVLSSGIVAEHLKRIFRGQWKQDVKKKTGVFFSHYIII